MCTTVICTLARQRSQVELNGIWVLDCAELVRGIAELERLLQTSELSQQATRLGSWSCCGLEGRQNEARTIDLKSIDKLAAFDDHVSRYRSFRFQFMDHLRSDGCRLEWSNGRSVEKRSAHVKSWDAVR